MPHPQSEQAWLAERSAGKMEMSNEVRQAACIEELVRMVGYLPEAQAVLDRYGVGRADTRQTTDGGGD